MKRRNVLDALAAARPADLDRARGAGGGTTEPGAVWRAEGDGAVWRIGERLGEPGGSPAVGDHRTGRDRRRRPTWVGVVAAAVGTAVVIGVVALPQLSRTSSNEVRVGGSSSAGTVLDAAADRAAEQRQKPGAYWRAETVVVDEQNTGPEGDRYRIRTRNRQTEWIPRDPASSRVLVVRGLSAEPASPEDRAAWRRAGAPRPCGHDTDCRNDIAPIGGTRVLFLPAARPGDTMGMSLGTDELLGLPQDPDALRERLLSFWPAYEKRMAAWPTTLPGTSRLTKDWWLWEVAAHLMSNAPISGGTRGALYRMVARMPGVRALGRVRDVEGRPGVGIAIAGVNHGGGQDEQQVIVDESDGRLLALQNVVVRPWLLDPAYISGVAGLPAGTVYRALVYERAGWTDVPPVLPEGCTEATQDSPACVR
ncbi:CU044_5270 family protein [Streptosporangium carneum]|uniref:Uncharacterized protein n=1 Tax=Streptosporangium carneum TaxID=47481 RepID=A0A9W6MC17_9ACTN|nr:CU044_5270 family protein [Streptosporangium carneum]GLK08380.1 hypothetical protein GCM10017600_17850 [Streptosporangium carneum]